MAEVDQQAVAEILRDMPLKAGDHLGAGLLMSPDDLAQVFRVELTGKSRGVHQVAEQHGKLAGVPPLEERQRLAEGQTRMRVMQERQAAHYHPSDEDAPFIHRRGVGRTRAHP